MDGAAEEIVEVDCHVDREQDNDSGVCAWVWTRTAKDGDGNGSAKDSGIVVEASTEVDGEGGDRDMHTAPSSCVLLLFIVLLIMAVVVMGVVEREVDREKDKEEF